MVNNSEDDTDQRSRASLMAIAVSRLIMGNDSGRNLHDFFKPRTGKQYYYTSIKNTLGLRLISGPVPAFHRPDNTRGPEKISNTVSDNHEPVRSVEVVRNTSLNEWENQLREAAYGQHPPDDVSKDPSTAGVEAQQTKTDAGNKMISESSGRDSDTTPPSRSANGTPGNGEAKTQPEIPSKRQIAGTPLRKMLMVRSDGTLLSPKAEETHRGFNPKRRRRAMKGESASVERIVILKYGSDNNSRISIGRRIQDIFSKSRPNQVLKSNIVLKTPKPVQLPRSTHPFFLGTSHRISSQISGDCIDPKAVSKESNSGPKREAKYSPLKPNALARLSTNASAWVNVSAFGGNVNGNDVSRLSRFLGAIEPIWPPKDMTHIRNGPIVSSSLGKRPRLAFYHRKMKYSEVQITEHEEVLCPYVNLVSTKKKRSESLNPHDMSTFRRPCRRIMTGFELQNAIQKNIASIPSRPIGWRSLDPNEDELSMSKPSLSSVHAALSRMHKEIATSLTAFDKFQCEAQDWAHKYAPKRAEDVLQPGREALILRDWLKSLTIFSVEHGNGESSKAPGSFIIPVKADGTLKRKKRKRAEELDDFLVSSEEDESNDSDEFKVLDDVRISANLRSPSKRSLIRAKDAGHGSPGTRGTNAVVISGPHGCGKTAAVYAAAEELGFEVFEINAGSRRSGKDVLDKVGDMAKNHLVNHAHGTETPAETEQFFELTEALQHDIESGRQATVNSFFKPKKATKEKLKCKPPGQGAVSKNDRKSKKQPQNQKQSLILLEEVDLLFEEDKQFWATTMDLILSSKRPIIMTCSDENLLPLDELHLYAILRFIASPKHLAIDYLMLVAGNEGHLLSRSAVSFLFKSKNYDLRASLMELNFYCQMAIGDTKGGLEWMLLRSSLNEPRNEMGQELRVVSDGTYTEGIGCFGPEWHDPALKPALNDETDLFLQIQDCLGIDDGNVEDFGCAKFVAAPNPQSWEDAFQRLVALDLALDCVSAADIFPCSEFRDDNKVSSKVLSSNPFANLVRRCWIQLCLRSWRSQN